MSLTPTLCAVRFGTGLSPDIAAPSGPSDILDRLAGPDLAARRFPQDGWKAKVAMIQAWGEARRGRDSGAEGRRAYRDENRRFNAAYAADLGRVIARAARTQDGFRERLVWFWADHFTVSEQAGYLRKSIAGYHEDAIRPHVAGRFADLLRAAALHPAMLSYLDQVRSIGPNSEGARRRSGGLNENLAREVLELHTLGVGGSYAQGDVRELAELLTGLGINKDGSSRFRPQLAEPGAETILGTTYGGDPAVRAHVDQALDDLAVHPDTARHISRKLAIHFVADNPPADLVQAMTTAWAETDGDLMQVYAVLLNHPASAVPTLRKVRRPLELISATARAFGQGDNLPEAGTRTIRTAIYDPLEQMGQRWQRAPGPNGWPEEEEAWVTPQALSARITWALEVPKLLSDPPDPRAFVQTALAELASPRTIFAAEAAEDRTAGLGLVLASPEFQRR